MRCSGGLSRAARVLPALPRLLFPASWWPWAPFAFFGSCRRGPGTVGHPWCLACWCWFRVTVLFTVPLASAAQRTRSPAAAQTYPLTFIQIRKRAAVRWNGLLGPHTLRNRSHKRPHSARPQLSTARTSRINAKSNCVPQTFLLAPSGSFQKSPCFVSSIK